jgi:lysophospholipase L1-like esterase
VKKTISYFFLTLFSFSFSLAIAEIGLRLKNSNMANYDIEMWRYAKELKRPSENPLLGHEHLRSTAAILQSVNIRTNRYGLRGAEIAQHSGRTVLFLGSSITLGWGVKEEETVTAQIQKRFKEDGQDVLVLNGGIGNYNTVRYVERFFTQLKDLNPTDIVVHYFLRDAEVLEKGRTNWFLRNSQLAVTLWNVVQRLLPQKKSLEDHYREVYAEGAPGLIAMEQALKQLAEYCHKRGIKLTLAMTPDVHNLKEYPFRFIHERMKHVATSNGYAFVDLYPALAGLTNEQVWSMPGDPHPNGLAHGKMAEAIYPLLRKN